MSLFKLVMKNKLSEYFSALLNIPENASEQQKSIQLNYAFLLFWSIFGEIHRELIFSVQKKTISEKSTEILRKFVFHNKFETGHIMRKIWICLNNFFFIKPIKWWKYKQNCFPPQSEPHTAKLCFSVVLKHFRGNSQRNYLFSPKNDYLRKEHWITQKVCFS